MYQLSFQNIEENQENLQKLNRDRKTV